MEKLPIYDLFTLSVSLPTPFPSLHQDFHLFHFFLALMAIVESIHNFAGPPMPHTINIIFIYHQNLFFFSWTSPIYIADLNIYDILSVFYNSNIINSHHIRILKLSPIIILEDI